jgi:hypothetical protein
MRSKASGAFSESQRRRDMVRRPAPTLLRVLAKIADFAPEGSQARTIAEKAIEVFGERAAIMLADWRLRLRAPAIQPRSQRSQIWNESALAWFSMERSFPSLKARIRELIAARTCANFSMWPPDPDLMNSSSHSGLKAKAT